MNTIIDQKKSLALKVLSVMTVAFVCVNILSRTVLADMGPKRSISIDLKNVPSDPYYVALLMQGELWPDLAKHYDGDHIPEGNEWIRDIFLNYDEDGYILFTYAGGASSIMYSERDIKESANISYGYMVPSTFKVILVTGDGDVTVSNEITTKAFHSECEYDYSTNTLKEVNFAKHYSINLAVESLFFFGATLFIEGIVLLCFGLFRKKNLLRFLIANIITQSFLYIFNLTCRLIDPLWQKYFICWIVVETLITAVELFIYFKKLVKKDGNVSIGRNIAYAIAANAISAFIDIPVILIANWM